MTNPDKERFGEIMYGLAENFGATLSKPGLAVRWTGLLELTIEEVEAAAMTIIRGRKYTSMPTVAEFLESAGHGLASIEDQATSEWHNKVMPAIGHHGGYESVVFDDAVTMAVLDRLGGWVELCGSTHDELKWIGKDFIKVYKAFHAEGIKETGYLPGQHEINNIGDGFFEHVPKPVLIGNPAKARAILEQQQPKQIEEKEYDGK